ncbi:MAG: hypothetical protein QXE90_01720 [Candidatus Micrarchaeia archaeon]
MAMDNISNGSSEKNIDQQKEIQSVADEKRKTLQQDVINQFKPKIDLLRNGMEKVKKYAEKEKEKKINDAVVEYENTIKLIEDKYSKEENEPKEGEIKKILGSVETLSLSEEEKKKIIEALDISFEEVIAKKKAEKLKEQKEIELDFANKRLEEAKKNANEQYNSFVNRYDSIFEDRIKERESQVEKLVNEINSAELMMLETMSVNSNNCKQNETQKEGNDVIEKENIVKTENDVNDPVKATELESNNTKSASIRNDLAKLVGLIAIPVIGIGGALFLHNLNKGIQNKSVAIENNKVQSSSKVINNKNSTIYVDILPIEIESGDNVPVSTPTIKSNNGQISVSKSTSTETIPVSTTPVKGTIQPETKKSDKPATESTQAKSINPKSTKSKEIKTNNIINNKEIIKKSNTVKENLGSVALEFKRSIIQLKEKAEELKYDGIPIAKGSSKSHILKFIKTIEEMDKNGKLSIEQKRKLSVLLREMAKSLDMYVNKERVIISTIPDDIIEIKRDVVKYIKWLLSQNINPDAIEYVIKQWKKSIGPKHLKAIQ